MRPLLALAATVALGLGAIACGGAGSPTDSTPATTSSSAPPRPRTVPPSLSATQSPRGQLQSDGDDDNPNDIDGDSNAVDTDIDSDRPTKEARRYHDKDDYTPTVLYYGHAAGASDHQAIARLVKRYFTVAATNNGAAACTMLYSTMAEAVPEDYGSFASPTYERGKTCQAVMSKLFAHDHHELLGKITVTGVRVSGDRAYAFFGSTTRPASFTIVRRERGTWKIDGLAGGPLP
jgi:hypothetical protein